MPITIGKNSFNQWPVIIPDATPTEAGAMSAADKVKLDSLTPGGGGIGGTAVFAGVDLVHVTLPSPIAGAAYSIGFAPSVDSGTGAVPSVGFDNKAADGFDLVTTSTFTGTIDWSATPT